MVHRWHIVFALLTLAAVVTHIWQLSSIPRGLYSDEAAIGYNAWLISTTGIDEHDRTFPLFFESFGDYKSPVYMYAAVVTTALLGPGEWAVRLPAALFWLVFVIATGALIAAMFPRNYLLLLATIMSASFLPWIFVASRTALEGIAQLAATSVAVAAIYYTYHTNRQPWWLYPLLAGTAASLSLYTYHAARLLTPLLMLSWLLVYFRRRNLKRSLLLSIAFVVGLMPLLWFELQYPDALFARFHTTDHLGTVESPQVFDRSILFAQKYLSHFHPNFLILNGDRNLRHATGFGGVLFTTVTVLWIIGMAWWWKQRRHSPNHAFLTLVFLSLLSTPIGTALTIRGEAHAQRTIVMAFFVTIFAAVGLQALQRGARRWPLMRFVPAIITAALIIESTLFLNDYFTAYPHRSVIAFQSYNFKDALTAALSQHPEHILVSRRGPVPYIQLAFYRAVLGLPATQPITIGQPTARANTCLIHFPAWRGAPRTPLTLTVTNHVPAGSLVHTRCYQKRE